MTTQWAKRSSNFNYFFKFLWRRRDKNTLKVQFPSKDFWYLKLHPLLNKVDKNLKINFESLLGSSLTWPPLDLPLSNPFCFVTKHPTHHPALGIPLSPSPFLPPLFLCNSFFSVQNIDCRTFSVTKKDIPFDGHTSRSFHGRFSWKTLLSSEDGDETGYVLGVPCTPIPRKPYTDHVEASDLKKIIQSKVNWI